MCMCVCVCVCMYVCVCVCVKEKEKHGMEICHQTWILVSLKVVDLTRFLIGRGLGGPLLLEVARDPSPNVEGSRVGLLQCCPVV